MDSINNILLHVHTGDVFFYWMGLVCLSLVYNAASIPLRVSFNAYSEHPGLWLTLDYLFADLVYILDMVMVKTHLSFRTNGILEVCVNSWSSCQEIINSTCIVISILLLCRTIGLSLVIHTQFELFLELLYLLHSLCSCITISSIEVV